MRMRFKPYARPELAAWHNFVDSPIEFKGRWKDFFTNPNLPLRLELGCGKGAYISQAALHNPAYNYLGIDIKSEVLVVAKRTIEKMFAENNLNPLNCAITICNIEKIPEIIDENDKIERIHINFCNPWYKSGDAKHRLTHPRQLVLYRDFLQENAEIWFKTDDDNLFKDSLRYFDYCGFSIEWKTYNLHENEPDWNLRTEHEHMFAQQGIPIKACIAQMRPANLDKSKIALIKNI